MVFKPRKIKIKVIGLGGGGASIVSEMARGFPGVNFLVADTDARISKKVPKAVRVFQFGEKITRGMGTGMDPELAERAAKEEEERIAKVFQGQDISIIIGCLGGGVASGAGPIFAEIAKNQKNVSLGIFTLPFAFEGEKKMRVAKKTLQILQQNFSGMIVVPNERIFQLIDKKTPLKKALSVLNESFACWLKDLVGLIFKPSLINIDFADLKTILKDRGNLLFFGRGVAVGPNRVEEVLKRTFQNPLFENPPKNVKRILFNISGGKDLKIKEVEYLSQAIAKLNGRAKIIFGISQSSQDRGKIRVSLLAVSEKERQDFSQSSKKRTLPESIKPKRKAEKSVKNQKNRAIALKVKTKEKTDSKRSNGNQRSLPGTDVPLFVSPEEDSKEKIRRSALEVKKAEEAEEEKEWAQEPEWQIPAFLRKKIK